MIKSVMLAWYGAYGGTIGDMLAQWEQAGFFAYILPFLLIFALVFGILTQIKLFEDNKAISGIIALAVGLMALQFGFVSQFFAEIFPKMGIGLAIILIAMIFLGIFFPKQKWSVYTLFGIGAIIFLVIIIKTAGSFGWSSSYWWQNNWPTILGVIFILIVIGIIVGVPRRSTTQFGDIASSFFKKLGI